MARATFRIWHGDATTGAFQDHATEVSEGMVVLDAVHQIQAEGQGDLAVRWNCKAGKCGSCSAEVNGKPRLMCMTRLNTLPLEQPVTVAPLKAFPRVKDVDDTSALVERLIADYDTVVVPGHFFQSPQHIRISFGGRAEMIVEALARLDKALRVES